MTVSAPEISPHVLLMYSRSFARYYYKVKNVWNAESSPNSLTRSKKVRLNGKPVSVVQSFLFRITIAAGKVTFPCVFYFKEIRRTKCKTVEQRYRPGAASRAGLRRGIVTVNSIFVIRVISWRCCRFKQLHENILRLSTALFLTLWWKKRWWSWIPAPAACDRAFASHLSIRSHKWPVPNHVRTWVALTNSKNF